MEIIIHQAILHVLDTTMDAPVLSGGPMELTAEKNAYLQNHIEKLLASDDIRQCRPLPDSAFKMSWNTIRTLWIFPAALPGCCSTICTPTPPSPGQTLPWWILPGTVRRGWAS
uniref:hypothetical protein n=1 Tax=Faecalibacterium prausnitzii TaxID=853 RepID=UPI00403856A1